MAQGENARKSSKRGKDWWGKRPLAGYGVSVRSKTNKFFKRLLHKIERKEGKQHIDEVQRDADQESVPSGPGLLFYIEAGQKKVKMI